MTELLKTSFARGRSSCWVRRHYPDLIYELSDGFVSDFKPKRSFTYRIFRSFWSILDSLVTFKFIRLAPRLSYIAGYITETVYRTH